MPAFSTHYIFAKELLPELREISPYEIFDEAVLIGSQGPDIFFFHRVFPWFIGKPLRAVGSELHRAKPSLIFDAMLEYAQGCNDKALAMSYFYGFVMHYALDRSCHPFVYSLQKKLTKNPLYRNPNTAHNLIEFSMDSYLLNKRLGIARPDKFSTADTINLTDKQCEAIAAMVEFAIKRVLGKNIDGSVTTAIKDTKSVQKITLDRTGVKRILISALDIPVSLISGGYKFSAMLRPKDLEKAEKYGNIYNSGWVSPFDNSFDKRSFEQLFEQAQLDAIAIIKGIINGDSTAKTTKNLSFLTGVEVK